ncbi:olfactory receptor 4C15-like [Arvicola amphibius]|uniref:olfactory receptor 4C15-like n=1 Tax=Arvicola amphibius TaxID=1047088 RepID=UPI0018E36A48|nr:olfactory receptor 4C15-like [Arvicola amphibius]
MKRFFFSISLTIMQNQSIVTEFILLGLSQNAEVEKILFVVFLLIYLATLWGNMIIVVTIIYSPALLVSPMYFFLIFLSLLDACTSSTVTPKMIVDFFYETKTTSFECCMTQLFAIHFFTGIEVIVLSAMAYDRYVAICKPLHYYSVMTRRLCGILVAISWIGGFLHSIIQVTFTLQLPFCGPNVIDHYMCDLFPLLKLACTDTHIFVILVFANSGSICIIIFSILLVSYGVILYSLRAHSSEGRLKALSTCGSHITVVLLFFVSCILIYARPTSSFSSEKNALVFATIITPLLNPIVYTFRNKEMKTAIQKMWKKIIMASDDY